MTGIFIASIGTAVGSNRIDNAEQAARFSRDAEFLSRRIGALSLPERAEDETACSLGLLAAQRALERAEIEPASIGLLVLITQNPDFGGLPHNSAVLHGMLGLYPSTTCFDLGLGCSGYVYGLSIASSLMRTADISHALVVTSDQYRHALATDDENTAMLFGDGASATVLSREGRLEVRATSLGTDGTAYESLIRRNDGIRMNGRAVFSFSRSVVPNAIREFCCKNDLPLDSVDQFLLHQGSRAIVDEIASKLEVGADKVPVELSETGNTVSSSLPFLLEPRLEDEASRRLILAGFGVGLSWGTAWLERK